MFLVGRTEDAVTQRRVDEEQIIHNDSLQLDVMETKYYLSIYLSKGL